MTCPNIHSFFFFKKTRRICVMQTLGYSYLRSLKLQKVSSGGETVKCQNAYFSSKSESVRIGKCQNRKVSELENVRIGKCGKFSYSRERSPWYTQLICCKKAKCDFPPVLYCFLFSTLDGGLFLFKLAGLEMQQNDVDTSST